MKTLILKISSFLTAILLCVSAYANSTTPVIVAVNDGSACVPQAYQFAAGFCMVQIYGYQWSVAAQVAAQCPGSSAGAYHDWGNTYSQNPGVLGTVGSDTNIIIDSWSGPVPDANGSPTYTVQYHWYVYTAPSHDQTVSISLTNTTSGYADLVWTYDGATQKIDQNTCPGTVDSSSATLHYNSDGYTSDSFSGSVNYRSSSSTNCQVTLTNPNGSQVIMDFSGFSMANISTLTTT